MVDKNFATERGPLLGQLCFLTFKIPARWRKHSINLVKKLVADPKAFDKHTVFPFRLNTTRLSSVSISLHQTTCAVAIR